MSSPKKPLKQKLASISRKKPASRLRKARIGVESTDSFFARMHSNARKLDRGEVIRPSITLSFGDPADLLESINPSRLRLMRQVTGEGIALSVLASAAQQT
jgi:predicted transcriptional regulator